MFTDVESMKDMMLDNVKHQHYTPILLLSRFTDIDNIRTKEAFYMLFVWKEELVHFLTKEDAGCVLNKGNVFVLVKKERVDEFIRNISLLRILAKRSNLETDTMILSDEMLQLFLDYA